MTDGIGDNVLGVVRCYADLHAIMRARAVDIELSRENIDDIAGLQDGYASKVLAPSPSKKLGPATFTILLPALCIKLVAVSDEEALAKMRAGSRMQKRSAQHAAHATVVTLSNRHFRTIGRKGGARSRSRMTPRQASALGRRAALIRWRDVRAAVS